MAKPHKPAADLAAYLAVRLVVCFLQACPLPVGVGVSRLLAWLAYAVDRRHREVARDNLRHAFPDWPAAKVERTVRGVYEHFLQMVVEIAHLPLMLHAPTWRKHVELIRGDLSVGGLTSGRPLLIVTGHFGNWEMAGFLLGLLGFRTHAIARVLDNPHMEAYLKRFRQKTGQSILAKKGDFDNLQGILAAGGAVATLADQDAGPRGQFVTYFGRPASTFKSVALLSLEFNVPLVVIGVPRVRRPMFYHVVAEEFIDPADYAGDRDAVKSITQRYTAALERLVRRHPEQYFWLHRRWKSQPPVRKGRAVAA